MSDCGNIQPAFKEGIKMKKEWNSFIPSFAQEFLKFDKPEKMVRMPMAKGDSFYFAKIYL